MGYPYSVKVRNDTDLQFEDRYDGIPYVIKPKSSINIPPDAAQHIFGISFLPAEDGNVQIDRPAIFNHVSRRWGWNRPNLSEDYKKIFEDMQFKVVALMQVERTVGEGGEDLADAPTANQRKNYVSKKRMDAIINAGKKEKVESESENEPEEVKSAGEVVDLSDLGVA